MNCLILKKLLSRNNSRIFFLKNLFKKNSSNSILIFKSNINLISFLYKLSFYNSSISFVSYDKIFKKFFKVLQKENIKGNASDVIFFASNYSFKKSTQFYNNGNCLNVVVDKKLNFLREDVYNFDIDFKKYKGSSFTFRILFYLYIFNLTR